MSSLASKQGPRYRHVADDAAPYETIGVEKLTPIIGAEISGVDLASPLSNRTMDEIRRALAENLVIFFRDQHITPAQHLAFGRKFGELHIHPAAPHEGDDPALMKIYADKDSPRANGEGWHTDVSCDVEPPMGSILYVNRGFTRFLIGVPRDESDAMLSYLYQHAENALFQCRFRWTENAIAFWDNRCAQHRAMWDYWPHTRAGTRVTVKGERPV